MISIKSFSNVSRLLVPRFSAVDGHFLGVMQKKNSLSVYIKIASLTILYEKLKLKANTFRDMSAFVRI